MCWISELSPILCTFFGSNPTIQIARSKMCGSHTHFARKKKHILTYSQIRWQKIMMMSGSYWQWKKKTNGLTKESTNCWTFHTVSIYDHDSALLIWCYLHSKFNTSTPVLRFKWKYVLFYVRKAILGMFKFKGWIFLFKINHSEWTKIISTERKNILSF